MNAKIFVLLLIILLVSILPQSEETAIVKYDVFSFDKELTLPGTPEEIYDAVTGDISGWWDHTFSGNPAKFYIDPFVGGGFWELFDDKGNGILHARVIGADRGKLLRFDGPLGLAGMAIKVVTTYTFEAAENNITIMKVSVHASGEVQEGLPQIVENVWDHFLFEQLEPYIKSGKHLKR